MIDWSGTRILDRPLPPDGDGLVVADVPYFVVADSGLHRLVAALAGAGNLCRIAGTRRGPVQVIEQTAAGEHRRHDPWTDEDDDAVDEDLAEYLAEAEIPPPPRGFTWFQRLPARFTSGMEVSRYVNRRLTEADPTWVRPDQVRRFLEPVVAELYQ